MPSDAWSKMRDDMGMIDAKTTWERYCAEELVRTRPILERHGFELDETQVHLGGERAVISGNKLVLVGRRIADGKRVIIKASSQDDGKRELLQERTSRELLRRINFAYAVLLSPEDLGWFEEGGSIVSVTAFLEQDHAFLERPLIEQFFLAMKAFEIQESFHAATYEQTRSIQGVLGFYHATTYLERFEDYRRAILVRKLERSGVESMLDRAAKKLEDGKERIEQYGGFLTHTDFVPHNFRIIGRDIYLLDHSSIRFGNKYEGWARFLNFMLLHHRELETAVLKYLANNRTYEESEALVLMRIYRLAEIVAYYVKRLERSTGNLHELDSARVEFWLDALEAQVDGKPLSEERIRAYRQKRDALRSEDEKQRQRGLH